MHILHSDFANPTKFILQSKVVPWQVCFSGLPLERCIPSPRLWSILYFP